MPRGAWATAVLLVVAGAASPVAAQPLAPIGPPPSSNADPDPLPPASTPVRRSAKLDHPPAILGAPIAVEGSPVSQPLAEPPAPVSESHPVPESHPIPAGFTEPPATQKPTRAAGLGMPTVAGQGATEAAVTPPRVSSHAVEAPARRPAPPPQDPVNDFLGRRSGYKDHPTPERGEGPGRSSWKFADKFEGVLGHQGEWFRSDHAFDGFISPVSNPFLFEDPRSLTEVRPLFIYQHIPGGQPDFMGGNTSYFGVQGRVAITDRWSFVFNKLGGIWLSPDSSAPVGGSSGFSELWFGPKYTFIRDENTATLVAGGLQFQVPVGSSSVFQSTGSLSLVPYVSYGQNLFRDFVAGSVNVLATGGYAFSTTSARSDYLFLSGHIDLDVLNWHRIYPLFEMNYFLYTTNGKSTPIGIEGRDLFNFGGQAKGHGLLTGAFGARFKLTESAQIGGAFEIPFAGPRDMFQYRFTVDFILRY